MLELWGRTFRNCDRISRRSVLRIGSLALGGVSLPDVLRRRAFAAPSEKPPANTAVIQLFLGGGPSQLDTFDLKPHAPADIRGEFHEIATSVPGIRISEHLPRLAAVMDKFAVVRSVTHDSSSHLPSSHLMQTGHIDSNAISGRNVNPSTGSIVARVRGPISAGLPTYVSVPKPQAFANAGYLGAAYNPFTTDVEPNAENFEVRDLKIPSGITPVRIASRHGLLRDLDNLRRSLDASGQIAGMDSFTQQAMDLITSPNAIRAFDIEREPAQVRERYGRSSMGQNLLLARRLVESGVGYVSCLSGGGWDTHVNNFGEQKNVLLPRLDQALSALITDLYEHGLQHRVLVNVMGEFGRTPKINNVAGRDHWPGAFCVLMAGGGLRMGQMIGTTDRHGAYPTSRPYSPGDVLATIYHVLGIDWRQEFHDLAGRPVKILTDGQPIAELTP
jgi:hypothetical protein